MTEKPISNRWKTSFRILLGISLLLWLMTLVDHHQLLASIKAADPNLLIIGFLVFSLQAIFEGGRLRIIFSSFGINYIDSIRLFFIGMFFGNFMPGMIGADVYQIYHMHSIRPGLLKPLSLSLFLRLTGLAVNIFFAVICLILIGHRSKNLIDFLHLDFSLPKLASATILISIMTFLGMLTFKLGRKSLHHLLKRIHKAWQQFCQLVRSFSNRQHIFLLFLGVSVVFSRVAGIFILLIAFGCSLTIAETLLAVTITALATALPISFAGLGIRELSLSGILIYLGVEPPSAIAISLTSRFFIWALSLFGGIWLVFDKTRKNANI